MKYEIINPSDKAYVEGENFKSVCVAIAILGEGFYGLQQIDDNLETVYDGLSMPPIRFVTGWFLNTFKQSIEDAIQSSDKQELKRIFETVRLDCEQSSLNDIVGKAQSLAVICSPKHKNLDETVSCLVKESIQNFDYKDRYADQTALIHCLTPKGKTYTNIVIKYFI